ncbi:hypothetical protein F4823DRAFT_304018 [Ustulina deusta]|nr:hypothetical protein F4823DRAFT_304018 [Ustulina deusta]
MRVSFRVGAHLRGLDHLHRSSAVTQIWHQKARKTVVRHISWMPFEQPDPSLYPPPPSLQPKRPAAAEVVSSAGGPISQTAVIGRMGTSPSTARAHEDPASGKPVPASVPASAMQTGPTPLSQVQKRTLTTATIQQQKHTDEKESRSQSTSAPAVSKPVAPPLTLHIRMPGHPATWPVQKPEYPSCLHHHQNNTT